ncbi:MAG: protein tyrosine phosphatase [archaeon]
MKKKLLFVCSGGLDRSPTAVELFRNNEKYEAKSCGIHPITESTPITKHLLRWADIIFVMEHEHKADILERFPLIIRDKPEIIVLNISNQYVRHDPELEKLLRYKLKDWLK